MEKLQYIKCGKLYDGLTDQLQEDVQILVEGNRIQAVGRGLPCPEGAEVIDLKDATVTPGLSDTHAHFNCFDWRKRRLETIYNNPVKVGMAFLYNARKSLSRGFTTIRTPGSNNDDGFGGVEARRLIDEGLFPGSRLFVAPHYICTANSHGDSSQYISSNPVVSDFLWSRYPGAACGADQVRDAVRRQIKYGADFIKIFPTGGFSTPNDGPEDQQLTDDELRAAIETAHDLGKRVTAHAYSNKLVEKIVNMGIDCVEHGALVDDPRILELMEKKGTHLVPTFCPYDEIIYGNEENILKQPPEMQTKLRHYAKRLAASRKNIVDSHLPLGYGTDIVSVHNCYDSGYEYKTWMKSGISPFRALRAATANNAQIMGKPGIGAIAPGYYADIAAWKRDLLHDEDALLDCAFVMKDGVIYPTECSE